MDSAQCSEGLRGTRPIDDGDGPDESDIEEVEEVVEEETHQQLSYGEIANVLTSSGMKMSASSVHNYMHAAYRKFAIIVISNQNGGRTPGEDEVEELARDPEFHEAVGECLQTVFQGKKG